MPACWDASVLCPPTTMPSTIPATSANPGRSVPFVESPELFLCCHTGDSADLSVPPDRVCDHNYRIDHREPRYSRNVDTFPRRSGQVKSGGRLGSRETPLRP